MSTTWGGVIGLGAQAPAAAFGQDPVATTS